MSPASNRNDAPLWPRVGMERRVWRPPRESSGTTGTGKRYWSAVVPPIADEEMILPAECARLSEEVRTSIASFDARVGDTLAPLEALLVRTEAAASSRLERVEASVDSVLRAEVGDDEGSSAADVIGNIEATAAASVLSDDISADTILEIHAALLSDTDPDIAGQWRSETVWIGTYSGGPPAASFVPPPPEHIVDAMEDLCEFMLRTDIPVFIQAMVMHAQFETIHPFPDGNGRVGRALIHALLRRDGLTKAATLPISAGIESQRPRYIEALTEYRNGDLAPIVELGADATFGALRNAGHLYDDVVALRQRWSDILGTVRSDSLAHRVAGTLISRPIVNVDQLVEYLELTPSAAVRTMKQLEALSIVSHPGDAARNGSRWIAHDVTRALSSFTERSINPYGRRSPR